MTKPIALGTPHTIMIPSAPDAEGPSEDLITIKISKKAAIELVETITDKILEKGPDFAERMMPAVGALLGQVKTHAPELLPVVGDAIKTLVNATGDAMGSQVKAGVGAASTAVSAAVGQAIDDTKKKAVDTMNNTVNTMTSPFRAAAGLAGFAANVLLGNR